jgi:hypothetical protein
MSFIKQYRADGGAVEVVDYHLGANLIKYNSNLFLMTRNMKDFPQAIFPLASTVSFASGKTIFTYGIYSYSVQNLEEADEKNGTVDAPF